MKDSITNILGRYLDLDRIVSISNAEFVNNMGSGGYFVKFTVTMQLLEKSIEFWLSVDDYETHFKCEDGRIAVDRPDRSSVRWWEVFMLPNTKGELVEVQSHIDPPDLQCVKDMQEVVDRLLKEWREWKAYILDHKLGPINSSGG